MGYIKKLIDYSNEITFGKQLACKKHIWSCQRFLNDVKKFQTDKKYPYYFNDKAAENFANYASLFKHHKGVLAGQYIVLDPIQHFVFGNIYGWYEKETGYRRFDKLYWQMARKNAKSQSLSLVASYEVFVFCKKEVAEVYSAGAKREQSRIVYDETLAMLKGSDLIEGTHYKIANGRLTRISNGAFMRTLSKEDKKTGDGTNPQCGIIDEYHQHPTSEILDSVASGMISRAEPLLAIITTAGSDLNNPCYTVEYQLISKILNPDIPVNLESYFVMVNELDINDSGKNIEVDNQIISPGELIDDINNEKVWIKANPIACSYPEGIDKIRKRLKVALVAPEKMRDFKTKTMNIWVNERALGFMNMQKWGACKYISLNKKTFVDIIKEKTDNHCYIGLDLSAKLDLTSCTFEFVAHNGYYYIVNHSFMPSERFLRGMKEDLVPYDLWEKQGYLTITDGAVVNYRAVKDYFIDECKRNGWYIEEVCVDPWGATQISSDLENEGKIVVEIIQGYKTLSEPTKNFREEIYQKKIVHDGNPVLTWAAGNTVTRQDHNQNILLDKSRARLRIDPMAATINSHVRAMVRGQSGSIYEKRGLRKL